jgi:hypothetical protein
MSKPAGSTIAEARMLIEHAESRPLDLYREVIIRLAEDRAEEGDDQKLATALRHLQGLADPERDVALTHRLRAAERALEQAERHREGTRNTKLLRQLIVEQDNLVAPRIYAMLDKKRQLEVELQQRQRSDLRLQGARSRLTDARLEAREAAPHVFRHEQQR